MEHAKFLRWQHSSWVAGDILNPHATADSLRPAPIEVNTRHIAEL
jgi:hypothetical protein